MCGAHLLCAFLLCLELLQERLWPVRWLLPPQSVLCAELLPADLCGSGLLREELLPAHLRCASLPPADLLCPGLPSAHLLRPGLQQRLQQLLQQGLWPLLPQELLLEACLLCAGLQPAHLLCSGLPPADLLRPGVRQWLWQRLRQRLLQCLPERWLLQSCLLLEAGLLLGCPELLCRAELCGSDLCCPDLLCPDLLQEAQPVRPPVRLLPPQQLLLPADLCGSDLLCP